ncbi:MAG: hypothetical protein HQL42_02460 [Alphaproteobacteria bacterium]|nr:hypothetical protein [Alphaproteobacteria bacterium]
MSMLSLVKSAVRAAGIDTTALYQRLSAASIDAAIAEQGLAGLAGQLRQVLPNVADQYTTHFDPTEYDRYWERKMRGLHAFQVRCMLDAVDHLGKDGLVLADIGDSSGNHALYLKALAPAGRVERVISVNLDPVAVDKVKAKGGDAILCRAEEMDLEGVRPDLFMTFEMVEHLSDPIRFLHGLATRGSADFMLMTVPLRPCSRFGGAHLRLPESAMPESMTAEEVHLYEFSPADWTLLARFAGWSPVFTRTYRQYPLRSWPLVTRPLWRALDFDGFFALLLRRDLSLAKRYTAW